MPTIHACCKPTSSLGALPGALRSGSSWIGRQSWQSATPTGHVCRESKADQAQSIGVQALERSAVERQRKGMLSVS